MQRASRPTVAAAVPAPRRDPAWELSLLSEDRSSRRRIWSTTGASNAEAAPSVQALSNLIPDSISDFALSDLAAQVAQRAPPNAISGLLGCLTCCYWRFGNKMDLSRVASCPSKRSVCGRVFGKGDLVWTCRECSKDPTCVQCDACFKKSNHVGHEVYFHRSSGGSGTCDCGDAEAWATAGNCTEHGCSNQDGQADPSASLPEALIRGLQAVLRGVLSVQVSYCTAFIRSFEAYEQNEFLRRPPLAEAMEEICMTVHNDDVHTYDHVIHALMSCGFASSRAQQFTQSVDREGHSLILVDSLTSTRFEEWDAKLSREAHLLVSYQPVDLWTARASMTATVQWMVQMGEMHEGLRRVLSREVLRDIRANSADYQWSLWGERHAQRDAAHCPGKGIWEAREQFPSEVTALSGIETLNLTLSTSMLSPAPSSSSHEEVFKQCARYPFTSCPFTPLTVWILASAYLPPPLVDTWESLIVRFQHDMIFKLGYSQVFSLLYIPLTLLYVAYHGCMEHSLLSCSVQFYTNNSIAQLLSPLVATIQGARDNPAYYRLFPESQGEVQVLSMLFTCLYAAMREQGAKSPIEDSQRQGDSRFVSSHAIRTKRLVGIIRDIEYLCGTPSHCLDILAGRREVNVLSLCCDLCTLLQGLLPVQRRQQTHIEREDDAWMYAADLMITWDHCLMHIISLALYDCAKAQRPSAVDARGSSDPHAEEGDSASSPAEVMALRQAAAQRCVLGVAAGLSAWHAAVSRRATMMTLRVGDVHVDCRQWNVLTDPCSVHHPLHHFLAHVLLTACYGRISVSSIFAAAHAIDWPAIVNPCLQALAFQSTVQAGCWKRNGYAVSNLIFNYTRPPLSRLFRDIDLLLVQTALVFGPTDMVLLLLFKRMEVLDCCRGDGMATASPPVGLEGMSPADLQEVREGFAKQCLLVLLHLFSYPPVVLDPPQEHSSLPPAASPTEEVQIEGVHRALAREIVHCVASGRSAVSEIEGVKGLVGSPHTVGDQLLDQVLQEYCETPSSSSAAASSGSSGKGKGAGSAGGGAVSLREASYALCVPRYPSLVLSQQEALLDRLRDRVKEHQRSRVHRTPMASSSSSSSRSEKVRKSLSYQPLFSAEALPIPHRDYASIRGLVFHPLVLQWLHGCALQTRKLEVWCDLVHMVTLQVHLLEGRGSTFSSEADTVQARVVRLVPLVRVLCDAWRAGDFQGDVLYAEGLSYVLVQLYGVCRRYPLDQVRDMLGVLQTVVEDDEGEAKGAPGSKESEGTAAGQRGQEKSRAEQVLAKEQARAKDVLAALMAEMGDSDEEDEDEKEQEGMGKERRESKEADKEGMDKISERDNEVEGDGVVCIICRETTGPLFALACCLPTTSLQSVVSPPLWEGREDDSAGTRDEDKTEGGGAGGSVAGEEVFRVVASQGCTVYAQRSIHSPVVCQAAMGDHLLCKHTSNTPWREVVAPLPGYALCYSTTSTRVDLTAPTTPATGKLTVLMHPVRDLQFLRNGRHRLHVTSCGHAMHAACYDFYFAREVGEHNHAIVSDTSAQECVCPMCKSLVNMLVPLPSKPATASTIVGSSFPRWNPSTSSTPSSAPVQGLRSASLEALAEANVRSEIIRWSKESIESLSSGLSPEDLRRVMDELRRVFDSFLYHRGDSETHRAWSAAASLMSNSQVAGVLRVHLLCSTLSTTLCTASHRLLREGEGRTEASPASINPATWRLFRALRQVLVNSPLWLCNACDSTSRDRKGTSIWEGFVSQLLALFLPPPDLEPSTATSSTSASDADPGGKQQWERRLANAPWHPVIVRETGFPVHSLVCKLLEEAQQACRQAPRWGWLCGPLLAMDLWPLCVLCSLPLLSPSPASSSSQAERPTSPLLHYLILAKVVQVLLDARATGRLPLPISHVSFRPEGERGESIRQAARSVLRVRQLATDCAGVGVWVGGSLAASIGTSPPPTSSSASSPGVESEEASALCLLAYLVDCLVPFMHVIHLLCTDQPSTVPGGQHVIFQSLEGQLDYLQTTWAVLGLPFPTLREMLTYLSDDAGKALVQRWCGIYRRQTVSMAPRRGDMSPAATYPLAPTPLRRRRKSAEAELEGTQSEAFQESVPFEEGRASSESDELDSDEEGEEIWTDMDMDEAEDVEVELEAGEEGEGEAEDATTLEVRQLLARIAAGLSPEEALLLDPPPPHSASSASPNRPPTAWLQRGLLPANPLVDEYTDDISAWSASTLCSREVPPFQGSLTAAYPVYDLHGTMASICYPDLSHYNFSLSAIRQAGLIRLPRAFTDLYQHTQAMLDQGRWGEEGERRGRGGEGEEEEESAQRGEDAVVCLLCGDTLVSGRRSRPGRESPQNPGEATVHLRRCGAGVGACFLVTSGQVLLARGGRAVYAPAYALYADEKGVVARSRGGSQRPLYLSTERFAALREMYLSNEIAREVTRKRAGADTIIRQHWF